MNRIIALNILFLAALLYFQACEDSSTSPPPAVECQDVPYIEGFGHVYAEARMTHGKLSPDGKTLAYIVGHADLAPRILFLDLQSWQQSVFGPIDLPSNIYPVGYLSFQWCPYDSDLLGVDVLTYTDTSGNGKYSVDGINAYIVQRDGKVVRRVTPPSVPAYGSDIYYFSTIWLYGSSHAADLIQRNDEIFIPQENRTVPSDKNVYTQSRDGKHWYGVVHWNDQFEVNKVDGYPLYFEGMDYKFWRADFSPSGKYLVIMGLGTDLIPPVLRKPEYPPNIFILDIETWLLDPSKKAPVVSAINFQRSFCKYTLSSYPVFITDSTLGVSAFGAYDQYQHYYEISIDGRLIKQLSQPL